MKKRIGFCRIPSKIKEMKQTLESDEIPEYSEECESCIYLYCNSNI